MSGPSLTLFDHPVSSYAQKARIVLREKALAFETISPLSGTTPNPEFLKANPRGEVPVLVVSDDHDVTRTGSYSIVDSRVICEFLEDRFPAIRILPGNPFERAKARQIEQVLDTQFEAVNWGWGEVVWMNRAQGATADHIKSEVERQIKTLQGWLEERIEPTGWLVGSNFSLADAAAAPILHRSAYFGFPPASGSKLEAWLEKVREKPSVKQTLREFDENVHKMAAMADIYLRGERKREYRDYRLEFMVKSGGLQIVLDGLEKKNIRFPWP